MSERGPHRPNVEIEPARASEPSSGAATDPDGGPRILGTEDGDRDTAPTSAPPTLRPSGELPQEPRVRTSLAPFSKTPWRRSSLPPSQRLAAALAGVRNPLWSLAALVVVIYGIHSAQAVLVPVVGAGLLAIIVSPGVRWLEDRRVPKVLAVLSIVLLMGLGFVAMGALVFGSLSGFRDSSQEYGTKLQNTVIGVTAWLESHGIRIDVAKAMRSVQPAAAVERAATFLMDSVGSLLSAVSNIFFVLITMVLILIEGETVPAKLQAFADEPEADISYFRQIAAQVQSYLAIKTVLSVATGLAVGIWASILDVDFAMLWGLLAFLLNYIPNIGSILAAIPAVTLAFIQHGVGTSLALGGGYVLVNTVVGNVVEPMWMGRKMGLSTTIVFISLFVWYEIWGPIGMLFSVPLTMVLKIMLEHSRDYAFVAMWLDVGESGDHLEGEHPLPSSDVEQP